MTNEVFELKYTKSIPKTKGERIIYSISMDYNEFHYSKHSPDKDLIEAIHKNLEMIRTGMEHEIRRGKLEK